jgi:hypothetical protein
MVALGPAAPGFKKIGCGWGGHIRLPMVNVATPRQEGGLWLSPRVGDSHRHHRTAGSRTKISFARQYRLWWNGAGKTIGVEGDRRTWVAGDG